MKLLEIKALAARSAPQKRVRRWLLLALKIAVAAALLTLALRNVSMKSQIANWASLNIPHMVVACLVIVVGQGVAALRWVILLRRWDVSLTVGQAFRLNMVGMFFNLVFPTSVGGDVVRAFFLARHSEKGPESLTSVLLTRFIGLVVLLLLGLVSGVVFAWGILPHWILLGIVGLAILGGAAALLVLRSSWLTTWSWGPERGMVGKLRHTVSILRLLSHEHRPLTQIVFLSLVIQVLAIHSFYEAARAVGVHTSYLNFLVFMPIITVVTMIPISIFGLGLRENAFIYLFKLVGITEGLSVSMSLAWFLAYVLTSLLGGVFLITLESSFLVRHAKPEEGIEPAAVPAPRTGEALE